MPHDRIASHRRQTDGRGEVRLLQRAHAEGRVRKTSPSRAVEFTDKALADIIAVLPMETPPERAALLPELLRAWAGEELREHLSRESRAAINKRRRELAAVALNARHFLDSVRTLDRKGLFLLAWETQLQHEIGSVATPIDRWPDDIERGKRRRDEALSWLSDMIDAIATPREKPLPDKRTLGYLVALDLAAIYELVTCTAPTRRNKPDAEDGHRAYGPFFDFVSRVCNFIGDTGSIDTAIRLVLRFYPERQFSTFVSNLQFRHPSLWKKLSAPEEENFH